MKQQNKILTLYALHGFERRTKGEGIGDILKDVGLSRHNLKELSFQKRLLEIPGHKVLALVKRLNKSDKDERIRIL